MSKKISPAGREFAREVLVEVPPKNDAQGEQYKDILGYPTMKTFMGLMV